MMIRSRIRLIKENQISYHWMPVGFILLHTDTTPNFCMSSDTPAVPRNRSVELQEVESSSSNENLSSMQNAHASTDALQALVTTCGEGEAVGDQKDFVARWWVDVLFVCCGVSVFARTEAFFMQTDLFVRRHAPGCALLRTLCVVFCVHHIFILQNAKSDSHESSTQPAPPSSLALWPAALSSQRT